MNKHIRIIDERINNSIDELRPIIDYIEKEIDPLSENTLEIAKNILKAMWHLEKAGMIITKMKKA